MGNEHGNMQGMSQGTCPECGFSHPPVAGGCPMKKKKQKSPSGQSIDYNILFTPLKKILYSQIKMKDIKDVNKMFQSMIVSCTKIAEEYKE